jgi:UDP-N-acetylmuramyl pentapeptide synthase
MKYLHKSFINKKIVAKHFNNRNSLLNDIKKLNLNNSVVLVKGSRGLQMEEFVSEIKKKTLN